MELDIDGRRAYAYTGGRAFDAALPTVVMVHGALNDHSVWGLQSRWLAHHGFGVLAVDLPGHGRSEGPALETVEAMADWVVALLQAAGARHAALVGHSMGSMIALEAAARLGERASALALVGTAYPMKVSPALIETAERDAEAAIGMVTAFSIGSLAPKPSAPGPGSWVSGSTRALMRRLQSRYAQAGHGNLFVNDFRACDRYQGAPEAAARVRCPVQYVLGSRDAMTPPRAVTALREALDGPLVTAPVGHSLMAEAPDAVLRALAGSLRAASAGPAS